MNKRENWLTITDEKKFCAAVLKRFEARGKRLRASKQHDAVQAAVTAYYRKDKRGAALEFAGPKGELVKFAPAVFRSRAQERMALAARTPQDIEAIARNTDGDSQDACRLGKGLIKHYQIEEHLDLIFLQQFEHALICSEGYLHAPWNPDGGAELGGLASADGQSVTPPGDFDFDLPSLYDVASDTSGGTRAQRRKRWWIVRRPMLRFDALAIPGLSEETIAAIEAAPPYVDTMKDWGFDEAARSDTGEDGEVDDCIAVYCVYAEKSAQLPKGLDALVLDAAHWLRAPAELQYARAPVFALVPSRAMFTDEGFSNQWGGLDIAQARAAELSSMLSNHKNGGLLRFFTPRGANPSKPGRGEGMTVTEYDHVDKEGNQIPHPSTWQVASPQISDEPLKADAALARLQDEVQGGNPVQRGDVSATKGDSGAKVAALNSVSQQVAAPDIRALFSCMRDVYNHIIATLQRRATIERTVLIAGKANQYTAETFVGERLRPIARIDLRQPDPSRDSFEGRQVMAEIIGAAKDERDRQMRIALMSTGNPDVATEDDERARIRIERENEQLRDPTAEIPPVLKTDPHAEEAIKHALELNSDAARDPAVAARFLEHIAAHVNARTPDHPDFAGLPLLTAMGQTPLPPYSMDPAADAANKQAQGGAGGGRQQRPPQGKGAAPDLPDGGSKPGKPGMPKDPTTGQRMEGAPPPPAATGG